MPRLHSPSPAVFIPHLNLRVKTRVFFFYPRYSRPPIFRGLVLTTYPYHVCNVGYWSHEQKPKRRHWYLRGLKLLVWGAFAGVGISVLGLYCWGAILNERWIVETLLCYYCGCLYRCCESEDIFTTPDLPRCGYPNFVPGQFC